MRIGIGMGLIIMVTLATAVQADVEKEKMVSLMECPKAVQKTLKREAGDGKLGEVEVEEEDGQTVYEAEVRIGNKEYEMEVRADGTLLSKVLEEDEDDEEDKDDEGDDEKEGHVEGDDDDDGEKTVRMADLPQAVQKTLKREARGRKIDEIEKEKEDEKVVFEAEVVYRRGKDQLEYEIEVSEDGTLLSKVLQDDEGKDDDDDDEKDDN